jgi:transcriptional regulator with XRE-family HTH domain
MENFIADTSSTDRRIAQRLKSLRTERGWSLDELARLAAISRATLSRMENGEVSPTASVLGKLCAVYGLTMSRLMRMVEDEFIALLARADQPVWTDPSAGFRRRSVSPPAHALAGEVIECELDPAACIRYDGPPRPGLEHHLHLIAGRLDLSVDGVAHQLHPGDCLRYQLAGASVFSTPPDIGARYFVFIV